MASGRGESNIASILRIVFSLLFVAAGAFGVYYVLMHGEPEVIEEPDEGEEQVPEPERLADYSWEQIASISAEIAAAGGGDASRQVAAEYRLVDAEGHLTSDTKTISLADGTSFEVRLIGIFHDAREDGQGNAGLTFMCVNAPFTRAMNESDTNEGGWEGSSLRAWLNGEFFGQLPEDVSSRIVPVKKQTNNTGPAYDTSVVTQTIDKLFLLSVPEICGPVSWNLNEYGERWSYLDGVTNAEGSQYQAFADAGVTGDGDPSGYLKRTCDNVYCSWLYRTPYTYPDQGLGGSSFFVVMDSGYPHSFSSPVEPQGILFAFCV